MSVRLRGPVWLVALAMISLSGCARMTVHVEMLNAAYWATPDYVDSITVAQIAEAVQRTRDGRMDVKQKMVKRDVTEQVKELTKRPRAIVSEEQAGRFNQSYAKNIDVAFQNAKTQFEFAFAKVRDTASASKEEDRTKLMREAGESFGRGAGILADMTHQLSVELGRDFSIPEDDPALKKLEDKTQKSINEGLIGNAGILDDPRASAVVYAPDRFWERRFNDTVCTGSGGNTDCAVKMEGLGSFTLKGVRLDATKITQATFSVAREAIQTVAAIYGVPVPKAAPAAGTQSGDAASLQDMQSPVKRERDAATSMLQLRLARLAVLEAIAGQQAAITGDQAARDQAVGAIKAVFQANRPQLDPPATP